MAEAATKPTATKQILKLARDYVATNTLGVVTHNGNHVCQTLELPSLDNQKNISCICEGIFRLQKRWTKKRGWHIWVTNVPNRDNILVHLGNDLDNKDNDKKIDSLGCICPNEKIEMVKGRYEGVNSKDALKAFNDLVFALLDAGNEVYLDVHKRASEY
jgi:hypothetical protein